MSENQEVNPIDLPTPANETSPDLKTASEAAKDGEFTVKASKKLKAKTADKTLIKSSTNPDETTPGKPGKNALTPQDRLKLLAAVSDLPFIHRTPKSQDYMRDLMLTVLDFHMQAEVVGKAINYFRDRVQSEHDIHTHADLTRILGIYPDTPEGNVEASRFLWNNRHWQRAHLLRGLLAFLTSIDVTSQDDLRCWARKATFDRDFLGKVKGLGLAVFQWLLIRMGVPAVKPDVWVINFAQRVTGKRVHVGQFCAIAMPKSGSVLNDRQHSDKTAHHKPWKKGKIVGQKAPFKVKGIWAQRARLQLEDRVRGLALSDFGIDSKLRGHDLSAPARKLNSIREPCGFFALMNDPLGRYSKPVTDTNRPAIGFNF